MNMENVQPWVIEVLQYALNLMHAPHLDKSSRVVEKQEVSTTEV